MTTSPAASDKGRRDFAWTIRKQWVGSTQRLITLLCDRIPLAFANTTQEAQEAAARAEREYLEPSDFDPAQAEDAMWHATDAYIDYMSEVHDLEQAHRNLAAAGLYHLFEHQLGQMLAFLDGAARQYLDLEKAEKSLAAAGISVQPPLTIGAMNELRLLANTVKHGEGRSSNDLKILRASLFDTDAFGDGMRLEPLAGHGIRLDVEQLRAYGATIVKYWVAIADQLDPPCL